MIRKIKLKLTQLLLKDYYQKAKCITVEDYNDGRILIGMTTRIRKIDVVWLTCGHVFWKEQYDRKGETLFLCETCLLEGAIKKWGDRKGRERFRDWWENFLKVKI